MKVLIISNLFPPEVVGGYELVAFDIAERLKERGFEVMVLTSPTLGDHTKEINDLRIERSLHCLPLSPDMLNSSDIRWRGGVANIQNMKILGNVLNVFKPDTVFCFNLAGLGPIGILMLLYYTKFKTLFYMGDNVFDNGIEDRELRLLFNRLYDVAKIVNNAQIFNVSDLVRREASDYLGFELRSSFVVPGWVDPSKLGPGILRAVDALPSHRGKFAFSSRIAPHKGIDIVIEASQLVKDRGYEEFVVDLYGAGEVAVTSQKIKIAGLSDRIRYIGSLSKPDMVARFADYDFLLFPTWAREPFGFVAAEAAYMGCPPILTSACGAAEWFRDGVDCLKIDRSPMALAEAMIVAMEMNDYRKGKLKQRCAQNARSLFAFDYWYAKLERECSAPLPTQEAPDIGAVLTALTVQLNLWT